MSDCCSSNCNNKSGQDNSVPRKFTCPVNHEDYFSVSNKTIFHHLKSPWKRELNQEQYYFCSDPDCEVTYFGLKGSIINKNEVRTIIGVKEKSDDTLICYCFGVSKTEAKKHSDIKRFVTQQTKEKNCACDVRNPSGRCCLKDFPKKH